MDPLSREAQETAETVLGDAPFLRKQRKLQRALEVSERVLGPEHPKTLDAIRRVAVFLQSQGKFDEALEMYQRAREVSERVLGSEHPDTALTLREIGSLFQEQGRFDEALEMYQGALEMYKRVIGPEYGETFDTEYGETFDTIREIGLLFQEQGKFDEALEMYQRAREESERTMGSENRLAADIVREIGSLFHEQGKFDEALEMYQRAREVSERVLGSEHPDTALTLRKIGSLFHEQGKFDEALEMYQRAREVYERVLGPEHSVTTDTVGEIGSLFRDQGKFDEALEMYQGALEVYERVLGPEHPKTLYAISNVAVSLESQGKFDEALEMYERVLEVSDIYSACGAFGRVIDIAERVSVLREQYQVNQKTSNELDEHSISGSDTDSNYACITDSSSSVGASSNTSAPSLIPQKNLGQIESDIARALSGMVEVSTIIKEGFRGLSQTKFNRRLIGSLREFSKGIEKSPSTKQSLSQQQLLVLRGIGSRVTLRNIALKIKESLGCFDDSDMCMALRPSTIKKVKRFTRGEIIGGYLQSSAGIAFGEPIDISRPSDYDSDQSSESSDDDEGDVSDIAEYDGPLQGILDYLKSDEILEIFKNAVIRRFLPARRKDNQAIKGKNVHQEGGITEILEPENKQQTPKYINEGDDIDDRVSPGVSMDQFNKGIGVQDENINSFTMTLMNEEVQKLVIENSPTELGGAIEGKEMAYSIERAFKTIQDPATRGSSQRCLSPQLIEGLDFSQDLSASHMPMVNDEYIWATRFSDGKTHITFEIARRWDLSNGIKRWVEDFIREPINWWPLSPQRHSAPQGYVYVKWKCRCGRRISSIIRKERMHQYHMHQRFRSHSGSSSSSNNRSSPPNVPEQPIANSANSNTLNNGALVNPILPSIVLFPGATSSSMTGQGVRDKLLMWCINLGSKARVVRELRVSPSDNDESIFRSLRAEYLKVRSWRRWFSLYTISYIRFVKFRLYRLDHMRVSCYNKEEMPTPNHPYYEYRPETVDVPPVPAEELMEYFEDPLCIGTTSITLDVLPKKTNGKMSLQEKYGWGLRACEALSFFRILILFLIVQAGPIAFFIYWLREHPGDLQNASVPLFLAFALMGTFIVFPTITEVRFYDI